MGAFAAFGHEPRRAHFCGAAHEGARGARGGSAEKLSRRGGQRVRGIKEKQRGDLCEDELGRTSVR